MSNYKYSESVRNNKSGLFIRLILILFCKCIAASFIHAQVTFYVSPSGNDSWSGLHETNASGDGPLATLPAAVDMVRAGIWDTSPSPMVKRV